MSTHGQANGAQMLGSPRRRYYSGPNLERAIAIADLRARTHKLMPRFVLEYLEGGAEDEASLERERSVYAEWRFTPRSLRNVADRSIACSLFGARASMPLIIAPTGLNGLFGRGADTALAQAAARAQIPFVQSTMSNETIEEVARIEGLRHWFQLYVFGEARIWRDLVGRADKAGCEALVLTTNSQIFGNREWDARTRATRTRPTLTTMIDAALHPGWMWRALRLGLPVFSNVVEYVPKRRRGFFESAFWIRDQMWRTLDWKTVEEIRDRWRKPFLLKGVLHVEDVHAACEAGVDGIVLSTHGGRQLDWTVAPLDLLPAAREAAAGRAALFAAGGVRRGSDLLKALALGAEAMFVGRAALYGLCAAGERGVSRALEILRTETTDALGLLGCASLDDLGPDLLAHARDCPRT